MHGKKLKSQYIEELYFKNFIILLLQCTKICFADEDMSLADALDTGLLVVEFDDTVDVGEPDIVTRTYAIHGVVDQRARNKVE